MKPETRIKVFREESHFSAAHFLVDMGKCELLHGHNYNVCVELKGEPGPEGAIVDFNALNPMIAEICDSLDHRVLIAENDKRISLNISESEVKIVFHDKRFIFPKENCVFLPLENTTVESLAAYFCDELASKLSGSYRNVEWIETSVREGAAQMGIHRRNI